MALGALLALAPGAWALDDSQLAKVRAGQTVLIEARLDDLSAVAGTVYVNLKPAEVMALLTDYRRYAAFMPGIERSEVVSRSGAETVVAMDGGEGELVTRRHRVGPHRIDIQLIQARDFQALAAQWLVEPAGEGSLVTYTLGVSTKLPLPGFVVAMKLKEKMATIMGNTRRYLDSRGKWTQH